MKIKMDSLKFKPYTIPREIDRANISLQCLLSIILGTESTQDDNTILVDSKLLLPMIYGLVANKIQGYQNPSNVVDIVLELRENFFKRKDYNKIFVCNYFFYHFVKITGIQSGYLSLPKIEESTKGIRSINTDIENEMVDAVVDDIRLLNMHAFLRLEIPLLKVNAMTLIYDSLVLRVKTDLLSSIQDPVMTQKKLHTYIEIANKLLEKKPVSDFHGAGSIYLTLNALNPDLQKAGVAISKEKQGIVDKLDSLFSVVGNYKPLREKMTSCSIPLIAIHMVDLEHSDDNANLPFYLEITGKKYYEIAQTKKNIRKVLPIRSYCKTNFIALSGMDCLMHSDYPECGFFKSNSRASEKNIRLEITPEHSSMSFETL